MHNDRAPVVGVVGRETGQIRLAVVDGYTANDSRAIGGRGDTARRDGVQRRGGQLRANRADRAGAFDGKPWPPSNGHETPTAMEDAKCTTIRMEGIWTGLRNFLRSFRGIHKRYLGQYVAIFEWAYNLKHVTRLFCGDCCYPAPPNYQYERLRKAPWVIQRRAIRGTGFCWVGAAGDTLFRVQRIGSYALKAAAECPQDGAARPISRSVQPAQSASNKRTRWAVILTNTKAS